MFSLYLAAMAVLLILGLATGLIRIALGPTPADSMLAAQLTSTVGVGLLAVLAVLLSMPALVDVALLLAVLAAVTTMAFVRNSSRNDAEDE